MELKAVLGVCMCILIRIYDSDDTPTRVISPSLSWHPVAVHSFSCKKVDLKDVL